MNWSESPIWLIYLSLGSLILAGCCCAWLVIDVLRHRQHMWIMNLVWPISALWAGPLALWAYYKIGRLATQEKMAPAKKHDEQPLSKKKPFWQSVAVGTSHCGSGCTLGDIVAEWFLFLFPTLTVFGITLHFEVFGHKIFAAWIVDYIVAFLFGVAFQYFTIKPMRNISVGAGLIEAIKADTLSLTAWQIGMYGWMAVVTFAIFGQEIAKTNPVFWFMMQIAMLAGFATAYPVNWWLLRRGIKEEM